MAQNTIIFVTGRKGSGKSTYAGALATRLYNSGRRVVILDPMGCFVLPGAPRIRAVGELTSPAMAGRSFVALPGFDRLLPRSVFLWAKICGDLTLIVDEIDLYLPHGSPDSNLMDIVRYGRHRGVSLVGISQRPANVVRDLTAQSDYIVMFQTSEPRDLEYLSARIGTSAAAAVSAAEPYRPLIYSAAAGGLLPEGGDIQM